MKANCVLLLAAAMVAGAAHALECYMCTDARSPHGCITPIKCKEDEPFCKTNLTISDGGLHITKSCASTCSPTMGRITTISCCNKYLCNVAPFKNLDQGGKNQKEGLLLRVGT